MRLHSAQFAAAVRGGGTRVQRAYIIPTTGVQFEVPITGFRITANRKAVCRYSGTVTLAPGVNRSLVEPYGADIRVWDGFLIGGSEELVPVGTMRIDDVEEDEAGALELSCFSAEKAVEDARFWEPRYIDNPSALGAITDLLAVANTGVSVLTTRDAPVRGIVYERERWQAVDGHERALARSLGVEVFVDAMGQFVIRNIPTLVDEEVWTVDAGATGVLVSYRTRVSREGVYNAVRAENDRVEQDQAPVFAIVSDEDPASPTYFYGPFGQVTMFYSSPLLAHVYQATNAASALLAQSRGLNRSVTFTNAPNPALEPGDVVRLVLPDGRTEAHIFDRIDHSSDGPQSGETRTTGGDAGDVLLGDE